MSYVGARRFAAPTLSPQGQNVLLLSDCHFQSRKDRYLPYQPPPAGSCRGLTSLPAHSSGCNLSSAIADAKSHPPPSSPGITDVRPMAIASNDRNPTPEKNSRRRTYMQREAFYGYRLRMPSFSGFLRVTCCISSQ